jgi:DNA repair ATPase RecN
VLDTITFKTELGDILTLEEVVILFDSIKNKSHVEMVSLSMFPKFNKLREEIIKKAVGQRNAELSQLLMQIASRKQEIKINMWKTLSDINTNKKQIESNPEYTEDLEQIIYEEEQIIKTYENSINTLERKEKKIMNGKYSRLDKIKSSGRKRTLKKQLEELKERLSQISNRHDNCFLEQMDSLDELISLSVVKFPKKVEIATVENYVNTQSIKIDDEEENMHYERKHENKEYYLYEPSETSLDDELIYQLLAQGKYDNEGGTINGLSLPTEIEEI